MNDSPDDPPTASNQRTFETEYTARPPSIAIIEAIAAIEGAPSLDVDFTLYHSINPDALDALFGDQKTDEETTNGIVAEFCVKDYTVNVESDGTLTIEAPEDIE